MGRRVETYEVYSPLRDTACVVRILRSDLSQDQAARDLVVLEGTLLKELTHPHLARGYELAYTPVPAMVVEMATGTTLAVRTVERPLEPELVAEVGVRIASALGYLHRQGWLHLDVTPSGILVGADRVLLTDLGLLGRTGAVGTTAARPPRRLRGPRAAAGRGAGPRDRRVGAGCHAGARPHRPRPFGDDPSWETNGSRLLPRPRQGRQGPELPGVPPLWRELLEQALRTDPVERPSMTELRNRLRELT